MTEDSIAPMWAEVFECEKAVIRHCRDAVDGKRPADGGQDLALFGLAFSGGGIRSATFNLGILQAMANKRLLRRIDYLSTVSGGGYIGGWFSALLNRKAEALINPLEKEEPEKSIALAIKAVEAEIQTRPETEKEPRKPEGHAINWLRRYSNYLTPRYGVFSLDTLAAVANISRNLLLNQAILLSLLTALLLFPLMLLPLWEAA
jgi:predicted acylesterase/phospholipase RssA